MNWIFILIALLAGAALPVQAGLNTQMAKYLGHPIFATLVSFVIGSFGLLSYALFSRLSVSGLNRYTHVPWYDWLAGILGAFYVAAIVTVTPRLGTAVTFALAIGGQMLLSIVLDHFGLLGLPVHQVNVWRLLGIVLLITGVILIRKF